MDQPNGLTGDDGGDIEIAGGPGCGIFGRDRMDVLQKFEFAPHPAPRVMVDQAAAVERRRPDVVAREIEDDASHAAAAGRGADALLGFIGTIAFLGVE